MNKTLQDFRQELHANPELGGQEYETKKRIQRILSEAGINDPMEVAETGLIYKFEFGEGPTLMVRVDIDALPIQEVNDFDHKSTVEEVSHKCGHDGHTTIGVALALKLKEKPLNAGTIYLLFQPSEENGEGARSIKADSKFQELNIDYVVALHNIPGYPMHQIIWKHENFTPAVQSLIICLKGKTSHAAEPLKGINPAMAIAELVQWANQTEVTDESDPDYHLITPVYSTLGSKDYGISAGYGELHYTLRSWKQKRMLEVTESVRKKANEIAKAYELDIEMDTTAVFESNRNHEDVVNSIVKAAKDLNLDQTEKQTPFPWGEDFGLFTQSTPGAMFGLGSGEDTPALHNPDYDFPDVIIETGAMMFYAIAQNLLED